MRTRTVIVQVTRRRYQCSVCKRWDSSKERIQQCEKLPLEKKFFRVGDIVRGFGIYLPGGLRAYRPQARVVAIRLEARDRDGFFDEESVMHRWVYELKWSCPQPYCWCKGDKREMHSDLFVHGSLKRPYASGEYHPGVLKKVPQK